MTRFTFTLLLALLVSTTTSIEPPQFEHAEFDIIILLDDSGSIGDEERARMMDVVAKLPNTFPLGPAKTLLAVAVFATDFRVVQNFTHDAEEFQRSIEYLRHNRSVGVWTMTDKAMKGVSEQLLKNDPRPDVKNLLILLTDGCPNSGSDEIVGIAMRQTEQMANEMRSQYDVSIFLVYVNEGLLCAKADNTPITDPAQDPVAHQLIVVGNKTSHRIHVKNFDELSDKIFEQMKAVIQPVYCESKRMCFFDKDNCSAEWETSNTTTNCIEPPRSGACQVEDCEDMCRDHWLKDGDCDSFCKQPAEWKCNACRQCHERGMTEASPNDGNGSRTKDETLVQNTPSDAARREGQSPKVMQESEPVPWLWIGVGIGLALLIVLLALLTVVMVRRDRRNRRRAAMFATTKSQRTGETTSDTSASRSGTTTATNLSKSKSQALAKSKSRSRTRSKNRKMGESAAAQELMATAYASDGVNQSAAGKKAASQRPGSKFGASETPSKSIPNRSHSRAHDKRTVTKASVGIVKHGEIGRKVNAGAALIGKTAMEETLPSWKPRKFDSKFTGGSGPSRSKKVG